MAFTPTDTEKTFYAYCSLNEMAADMGDIGIKDDILRRFILPASQYLLGEIGQFIPTIETRLLAGNNRSCLVISPLLALSAVSNYGTALQEGQYILEPVNRMWKFGPYVEISLDPHIVSGAVWIPIKDAVQISGLWGLYNQIALTGARLSAAQTDSAEQLEVSDGGAISAGMVILVDSEIQFVTGFSEPVAAVTDLAANCDNQTESLTVADSTNVYVGEIIRIDFEQMKVLDKKTGKLNVVRGWAGSTKTAHASSADIDVYKIFKVERAVNGSEAAAHSNTTVIKRYMVPEDINYLTRQIATLMMKKAQTGYAGRSGNSETGETFYNFEFPRDAIARVAKNYFIPHVR